MAVIIEEGRLTLTGFVGESTLEFDGYVYFDGFTHTEVVEALGEIGMDTDLTVHINSGGGYATEGTAIRSVLADREGRTDVVIDGIAASSASIIAMAGETVSMSLGSLLMIHDPSGYTSGTVEDHEKSIKALNSIGNTFARVYARKSGMTDEECREVMKVETWYTPEEAVEAGLADEALDDAAATAAAFPYQNYNHAPRELVAMAKANGWRTPVPISVPSQTAKTPRTAQPTAKVKENPPMAQTPTAPEGTTTAPNSQPETANAEDIKARIKAITNCDEAKGQETLANHLAFNTEMSAEDAIEALTAAAGDATASTEGGESVDPADYAAGRSGATSLAPPAGKEPKTQSAAKLDARSIYARRAAAKEA